MFKVLCSVPYVQTSPKREFQSEGGVVTTARSVMLRWIASVFLSFCVVACGGGAGQVPSASAAATAITTTPAVVGLGASSITAVNGTITTTPMGQVAAARLVAQATFGANYDQINAAAAQTYDDWFAAQAAITPTYESTYLSPSNTDRRPVWWTISVTANDQLRQRIAFALSEILVVSDRNASLQFQGQSLGKYYDILVANSLGNYRDVLDAVSHSPAMGLYLTYWKNVAPNPALGTHADENYARELMQLFTVGLWQLNPDGSRKLDGAGKPIPAYSQADVTNLARVFTGWGPAPLNGASAADTWAYGQNYLDPMICYPTYHDSTAKTIINNTTIPAGGTCQSDMEAALDAVFNHPNVGPFLSRQLIQRLVTSNPSAAYVARAAAIFNNNGAGVRGDLYAVVKEILTDPEATGVATTVSATPTTAPGYGKLREPVVRLAQLWRVFSATDANNQIEDQLAINAGTEFGENSLDSPTVFNFFKNDYLRAGALTTAGLVAPEFQITNEASIVQTANDFEHAAFNYMNAAGTVCTGWDGYPAVTYPTTVFLKTGAMEALASDPATLVDALNVTLMAGQMPASMRNTLINYINTIPLSPASCYAPNSSSGGSGPAVRVIEATQLIINSSQYAIQR